MMVARMISASAPIRISGQYSAANCHAPAAIAAITARMPSAPPSPVFFCGAASPAVTVGDAIGVKATPPMR